MVHMFMCACIMESCIRLVCPLSSCDAKQRRGHIRRFGLFSPHQCNIPTMNTQTPTSSSTHLVYQVHVQALHLHTVIECGCANIDQ